MKTDNSISKSDAIQAVILGKPLADYLDVVDEVKKQYGIKVSQREVEETYVAMKKRAESAGAATADSKGDSTESALQIVKALLYVEEMGGFANARAAIDKLETTLKGLKP